MKLLEERREDNEKDPFKWDPFLLKEKLFIILAGVLYHERTRIDTIGH